MEFVEKRDEELKKRKLELEKEINSFDQEYKEFESNITNITQQRFDADKTARTEHTKDLRKEVLKYKEEIKCIKSIHNEDTLRSEKDIAAMTRKMKDLHNAKRKYENVLRAIKNVHKNVKITVENIARENVDAKNEFDETEKKGKNECDRTFENARNVYNPQ
eukprot:524310_1